MKDFNEFDREMMEKMNELYCEEHDNMMNEYNYIINNPVSELDYDEENEEFIEEPDIFAYEDYLQTGEFGVWGDGTLQD